MSSPQPDQHPVATTAAVATVAAGAGGLLALDRIRRLYTAAETRALQALRKAVTRVLRAPIGDATARFDSSWRLGQELSHIANRITIEAAPRVAAAVQGAHQDGVRTADRELPQGTDPQSMPLDVQQRVNEIQVDRRRIVQAVDDQYRRIVEKTIAAETNRINRQRVAQRALDEFAERGIAVFVDKAGRQWSIDAYVEMLTRTVTASVRRDAVVKRVLGSGRGLVMVTGQGPGCGKCAPFYAQILSVGPDPDKKALTTLAAATAGGLFHPNCHHGLEPWNPSKPAPKPQPSDPAAIAARDRLRYLERRVRAAKRKLDVALDPQAQRKAQAEINAAFAAIRDHIKATGLTRQRQREQTNQARG